MQINNRTEYMEIPISALGFSTRTFNALMRAGYNTLYLLIQNYDHLSEIRNLGYKSIDEINTKLNEITGYGQYDKEAMLESLQTENGSDETDKIDVSNLSDDILDRPASDLFVPIRIEHALKAAKIETIRQVMALSKQDILGLRNLGTLSQQQLLDEMRSLCELGEAYFEKTASDSPDLTERDRDDSLPFKGFDFKTIETLTDHFFFKPVWMTEWFGLSRQSIYNALEKRSPLRRDCWTNKQLDEDEKKIFAQMISDHVFEYKDDVVICRILNNRDNDFACVFVYEDQIKCFFLNDLPEDMQTLITETGFHRFTEKELAGGNGGNIVYCIRKPYFLPTDANRFRSNAQSRGMTADEYSRFMTGYPLGDARAVTDDQIIAHFKANLVNGKVYISSDPQHQWIRSLASRNGYTIKEFIELYDFESALDGTELTTDGARERHIEALKKHVVRDNVVYFPTDSHVYKVLTTYCFNKKLNMEEYIRSLGFERTTVRPEAVADEFEQDMQVRKSDGKFEDRIFASYPLLGSKILKQKTLDQLNENTRKYIDTVLREPLAQLNLRAEMQITLALINNAKNWKNEENGNFWNYISLQFGYRDTDGAVVRLLQKSLEDAMKQNHRLFIEDENGRAFKSTTVVHALTTRKSWMALFDFLFDFYKNNLNWKYIPGDPLFKVMVESLRKKLDAANTEDAELEISSRVYSFQEGIRKLVIFRPMFTRDLFEKLIGRIDSLVNSETLPVKTYEEQLCEEWFKEKITAIANSRRSVRQSQSIPREVVIDYSRIRPKFILKNENNVLMLLPDIRLKGDGYSQANLSVLYDGIEVHHQRMEMYGDELGKSLSGVSLSLPAFRTETEGINIRIIITGDDETIYDSEETLYRSVFVFSAGTEFGINQIKRDKYTVVLPQTMSFDVQKAEVSSIDDFQIPGLKAYYIELEEGYVLTAGGKLISFDSSGGSDIRVLSPRESLILPVLSRETTDCYFAYKGSSCSILLGDPEYAKQYILLKDGERVEFSELQPIENSGGLAFSCPISGEDTVRIQVINLDNERLVFDRSYIPVGSAECRFSREFFYSPNDYKNAGLMIRIDDFEENVTFTQDDEEVIVPFRDGVLRMDIPKVTLQETTGLWLNGDSPVWYAGNIPQNSFLKVDTPKETSIRFFVGGKDILYDGQGLVTIGNILQSFAGSADLSIADIFMEVSGTKQTGKYLLTKVSFKERFLKTPRFWTNDDKLFWDQGNGFIGNAGRTFCLSLTGEQDERFELKLDEETECVDLPDGMAIGNYRYEISILSGSLFKKERRVLAQGDCIIGDPNLLRFRNRRIAVYAITDEFNEEAGHIQITPCFIDHLEFQGIQETSEGNCPVYSGILYAAGFHGERYEFSYEEHTNSRGIKKMMVNPVRIVYIGESALCIADSDGDGLYYYHYYDKYRDETIFALTDREYTPANKRNYSNADLYLYRTERI